MESKDTVWSHEKLEWHQDSLLQFVCELTGARSGHGIPVRNKDGRACISQARLKVDWTFQRHTEPTRTRPTARHGRGGAGSRRRHQRRPNCCQWSEEGGTPVKRGKAAGLDEISLKLLKHDGPALKTALTRLLNGTSLDEAKQWLLIANNGKH